MKNIIFADFRYHENHTGTISKINFGYLLNTQKQQKHYECKLLVYAYARLESTLIWRIDRELPE